MIPAAIDVETTGLYPSKHDIIEIAVVAYDPKTLQPTSQRFHRYIYPERIDNIDPYALSLNKIDISEIPKYCTQEEIKKELLRWISEQGTGKVKLKPIGHNYITFDILFLKEWLGEETYDNYFHYRATDTCQIARLLKEAYILPVQSCSLKALCEYYDIPEPPHGALEDTLITLDIYACLLDELHPAAGFWRGVKYYLNLFPNWIASTWKSMFKGGQE